MPGWFTIAIETLKSLAIAAGAIGVFLAWLQYRSRNRFERLQNLTSLWAKFHERDSFLALFDRLENDDVAAIEAFPPTEKWRFLAVLDEVAVLAELGHVDRRHAIYLFQWHLHQVFSREPTSEAFWKNIGGSAERERASWRKPRSLARIAAEREHLT